MSEKEINWESAKGTLVDLIGGYRQAALVLVGSDRDRVMEVVHDLEAALLLVAHGTENADPSPRVNLPTEPTLGWASGKTEYGTEVSNAFGSWAQPADLLNRTGHTYADGHGLLHLKTRDVTAFTPATAVPTEALDRLREYAANSEHSMLLGDFLAAVDAANGDHA